MFASTASFVRRPSLLRTQRLSILNNAATEPESGSDDEAIEPTEVLRKRAYGISAEAYGAFNHRRAAYVPQRYKHSKEDEHGLASSFQNCPLFAHIDRDTLLDVIRCMPLITLQAGEHVVRQGEQGDSLFVILRGEVECWNEAVEPRKFICRFSEGRIFGELAMLHNTPRKLSVIVAPGQPCTVARLYRTIYRNLIFRHQMVDCARREECLRRVQCFETLGKEQILRLQEVLEHRSYDQGAEIIRQGEPGDELFIVFSGECAATVITGQGADEEDIDMQEHRRYLAGSLFGERALLSQTTRAATVNAVTDVEILVLSRIKFERLLGPLSRMQAQHYMTDPRKSIADFFQTGNKAGCLGVIRNHIAHDVEIPLELFQATLEPEERTDWFAVYRPTSRDAIAQMLGGRGVGKGLNVKGKSAKRGRNSGYVPFLQICDNQHKKDLKPPHADARLQIYFQKDADREAVLKVLQPLLEDFENMCITADRVIFYLDEYDDAFGLEVPEPIIRKLYITDPDISHQAGWETGRKSEPAFMDMNFAAVRGSSSPKIVLFQGDADDCFNPHGLLIAYAEKCVKPVVSDFDTFLVGSRNMDYDPLAEEQVKLQEWALENTRDIFETALPGSWTTRWLDVLGKAAKEGFHPTLPRFGFGDATSYRLTEEAVNATADTGAIRHGSECFNFVFPQELDAEYLVVWQGYGELCNHNGPEWKYLDEDDLREFLILRAGEGYVFPMNPIWIVRDLGWYEVFESLRATEEGRHAISKWLSAPIVEQIEKLYKDHPDGFNHHVIVSGGRHKSALLDLDTSERAALAMDDASGPEERSATIGL